MKRNWLDILAAIFILAAFYMFCYGMVNLGIDSFGKFLRFVMKG